jgi:hypothetical protein
MATSLSDKSDSAKPKFLEQVRTILRTRHHSLRSEEAYLGWIRRFILFHASAALDRIGRISQIGLRTGNVQRT